MDKNGDHRVLFDVGVFFRLARGGKDYIVSISMIIRVVHQGYMRNVVRTGGKVKETGGFEKLDYVARQLVFRHFWWHRGL